jgi:hypothetical protein
MHGAAAAVVQGAMGSHPSALTHGVVKMLYFTWIEEVRAPDVRLALL